MESYPIRSVLLGGFHKEDVVRYLEDLSKETDQEQQDLREENDRLRRQVETLGAELDRMSAQLTEAASAREGLEERLRQETARRVAMEPLRALETENARLREEAERLRSEAEALRTEAEGLRSGSEEVRRDAAAYAQFRERLGAIECEARERADALEANAAERIRRTVAGFNEQYQGVVQAIEATAGQIAGELRKVEYDLSQLPRAMDQAGRELNALADHVRGGDADGGRPDL